MGNSQSGKKQSDCQKDNKLANKIRLKSVSFDERTINDEIKNKYFDEEETILVSLEDESNNEKENNTNNNIGENLEVSKTDPDTDGKIENNKTKESLVEEINDINKNHEKFEINTLEIRKDLTERQIKESFIEKETIRRIDSEYELNCISINLDDLSKYIFEINLLKKLIYSIYIQIYNKSYFLHNILIHVHNINLSNIHISTTDESIYNEFFNILATYPNEIKDEFIFSIIVRFEREYINKIKDKINKYEYENWIILEKSIADIIDTMKKELLDIFLGKDKSTSFLNIFPEYEFNLGKEICNIFNVGIDDKNEFGLNKYYLR